MLKKSATNRRREAYKTFPLYFTKPEYTRLRALATAIDETMHDTVLKCALVGAGAYERRLGKGGEGGERGTNA